MFRNFYFESNPVSHSIRKSAYILLLLYLVGFSNPGFAQEPYKIFALKYAERITKIPSSARAVGDTTGDSTGVYYMFWLLQDGKGKNILVDVGCADTIGKPGLRFTRPDVVLEKFGVSPDSISEIILTHPHWDHAGGVNLFPHARVWIQKEDYLYFVGTAWQKGGIRSGFTGEDVHKLVQCNLDGRLAFVDGDGVELFPGIKVFTGSKHTYASQYVLVGSGDNAVIVASDNCWFYRNMETMLPIPVTHDANAYINNLKRMKTQVKNTDYILPGHDPLVFEKFTKISDSVIRIR